MMNEVIIPEKVSVDIQNKKIKVSGPKGELEKEFKHFFDIKIVKKDNKVVVASPSDKRKVRTMMGTIASHIRNMVKGVTEGFTYQMRIVYSHFPVNIEVKGDKILINNFLGENVPRVAKKMGDTKIKVEGKDIILTGIDKEAVGQTAANIEQACRITKFDRRVFQDGIYIVEKP